MADAGADTGGIIHDLLSDLIPYPIFRILAGFSNLIYRLLGTANDPTSWSSTLLPPLVTLLIAYFALITAYRTVRNMLALAWWGIKWGAILGGLIAVWAWWTENADAVHSTGVAPNRGFFQQLSNLGPLMNTLYTQMPDLGSSSSTGASRRSSSPYSRRRSRNGARRAFDVGDQAPDDLGLGFDAFSDLFGRNTQSSSSESGVDFSTLLRTIITEGQRQGIDALSALRAAGRIPEELRRFQENPSAWFDGVGDRFRTPFSNNDPSLDGGRAGGNYNTRSRTRAQQQSQQRNRRRTGAQTAEFGRAGQEGDSWWSGLAEGLSDFFKSEDQPRTNRRTRSRAS